MSVVGIDIGNAFCVVAAAGKGGIDVVLSEESKRETPACVAFGDRQRFLGAAAASSTPGTIVVSQIKRLIGRPLGDDSLKTDLTTLFPNTTVSDDGQGYPLLHFKYHGRDVKLSPTQLLGMLLGSLKRSAERHLSAPVSDCCIAVPAHFNDIQRRAVFHAAEIAGLRPLRLLHECSAAALEYGIYRGDFPVDPEEPSHIAAFVDVGHSATQVSVAEFRDGHVRILSRTADRDLGGRDFDEALFEYFAANLKAEDPDLDVSKSVRASARLRAACEKVKKVLSANPEAPLHIECFVEDKDAAGLITRDEFERICSPLLNRLRQTLRDALQEAKINPRNVAAVELIGSGSRVPAVVMVVAGVFEQEPRRTLNASECVARGCALQAAMLSPAFRVKEFKIHENVPFAINAFWKETTKSPSGFVENYLTGQILAKGDCIPTKSMVAMNVRADPFSFRLLYADMADNQLTHTISTCTVGPLNLTQCEMAQLIVKVDLNIHGMVSVDSIKLLRDVEESSDPPVDPTEDDSSMQIDEDPTPSHPMSESHGQKVQNAQNDTKIDDGVRTQSVEDINNESAGTPKRYLLLPDADESSDPPVEPTEDDSRMKIDEDPTLSHPMSESRGRKVENTQNDSKNDDGVRTQSVEDINNEVAGTSRRFSGDFPAEIPSAEEEIEVTFSQHVHGPFSTEDLEKAKELEALMMKLDKEVEQTKDQKNALESYVYEMRNKLRSKYLEFVREIDRHVLVGKLQEMENWLYDEGDDVELAVYVAKLNELKMLGDPIEMRFRKSLETEAAFEMLQRRVDYFWKSAEDNIPQLAHIKKQDKSEIIGACRETLEWMQSKKSQQRNRLKWEDPVVTVEEIRKWSQVLTRCCSEILTRPPPPRPTSSSRVCCPRHTKQDGNLKEGETSPNCEQRQKKMRQEGAPQTRLEDEKQIQEETQDHRQQHQAQQLQPDISEKTRRTGQLRYHWATHRSVEEVKFQQDLENENGQQQICHVAPQNPESSQQGQRSWESYNSRHESHVQNPTQKPAAICNSTPEKRSGHEGQGQRHSHSEWGSNCPLQTQRQAHASQEQLEVGLFTEAQYQAAVPCGRDLANDRSHMPPSPPLQSRLRRMPVRQPGNQGQHPLEHNQRTPVNQNGSRGHAIKNTIFSVIYFCVSAINEIWGEIKRLLGRASRS